MKRPNLSVFVAGSTLLLSIVSLLIYFDGAASEPYIVIRSWDAITQIGVAMLLMLLWLQLAGAMLIGVFRRKLSTWWLLMLVWVLACERYLIESPTGYIQDIKRYVASSH